MLTAEWQPPRHRAFCADDEPIAESDAAEAPRPSVLEIWDFLSGTSDDHPIDGSLVAAVVREVESVGHRRPFRVLDLGGGAGNPSIGLAAAGYDVTLVDADADFVAAARRRAVAAQVRMNVVHDDWRDFVEVAPEQERYDAILFMGNALAYQDSWPDRDLPEDGALESLRTTIEACRGRLSATGVILIEGAIEPSNAPLQYTRRVAPAVDSELADESVWIVERDYPRCRRVVDTLLLRQNQDETAAVVGRVAFACRLLTSAFFDDLVAKSALVRSEATVWPRPMFTVTLLRNGRAADAE